MGDQRGTIGEEVDRVARGTVEEVKPSRTCVRRVPHDERSAVGARIDDLEVPALEARERCEDRHKFGSQHAPFHAVAQHAHRDQRIARGIDVARMDVVRLVFQQPMDRVVIEVVPNEACGVRVLRADDVQRTVVGRERDGLRDGVLRGDAVQLPPRAGRAVPDAQDRFALRVLRQRDAHDLIVIREPFDHVPRIGRHERARSRAEIDAGDVEQSVGMAPSRPTRNRW